LPDPGELTPVFKQWHEAKQQYPDVLLLFRMGDFYEIFGEDAEIAARELELTLTKRKAGAMLHLPMCGVPYHAVDRYLAELIRKGYRAAICDQIEDARKAKGLVKRAVTRVVTAGTLLEDELLDRSDHNFLLSVATDGKRYGLAVVDVSTGDFMVTEPAAARLPAPETPELPETSRERIDPGVAAVVDEAARLAPTEILLAPTIGEETGLRELLEANLTASVTTPEDTDSYFRSAQDDLKEHFGVESLRGYGCEGMPAAIEAAAQALRYLKHTHLDSMPHLAGITTYSTQDFLIIDAATRRNLELTATLRDNRRDGSLLALLDRTRTAMGGRLLRSWLLQPLLDVGAINRRLDSVDELFADRLMAEELGQQLREVYDMERLTSRASAGRANARDLVALRNSLQRLPMVIETLERAGSGLLAEVRDGIDTADSAYRRPADPSRLLGGPR